MGFLPGIVKGVKAIAKAVKEAIASPEIDLEYDIYGCLICDIEMAVVGMETIPVRVSPTTRQVIPYNVPSRLWG